MTRRFNKYIQVAGRATRQALKEEQRLAAEKRGTVTLKMQQWKDGKAGTAVSDQLSSALRNPQRKLTIFCFGE